MSDTQSGVNGTDSGVELEASNATTAASADHASERFARAAPPPLAPAVHGNLEIRHEEMQALVDGRRIGLTIREFQVLAALCEHEDRVLRRGEIYRLVWEGDMKHRDRSVDVFVRKLRGKLALAAPDWVYIHTHFGIGYRFAPQQLTAANESPTLG